MAGEGKLREQENRGQRAKALLENEILTDAFDKIENALLEDWKTTSPEDSNRREDAWRSYKLLKNLKGVLENHVNNGDFAAKELLRMKDPTLYERIKGNA